MRKKELISILIFILSLVALLTTSIYAWFSLVEKTQPIIIYSGSVNVIIELYQIEDEEETPINNLVVNNFVPGDIYYFKLKLINQGSLDTNLEISFEFNQTSAHLKPYAEFKFQSGDKTNLGNVLFSTNSYLYDEGQLAGTDRDNREIENYSSVEYYFQIEILPTLKYEHLQAINTIKINKIKIIAEQKV